MYKVRGVTARLALVLVVVPSSHDTSQGFRDICCHVPYPVHLRASCHTCTCACTRTVFCHHTGHCHADSRARRRSPCASSSGRRYSSWHLQTCTCSAGAADITCDATLESDGGSLTRVRHLIACHSGSALEKMTPQHASHAYARRRPSMHAPRQFMASSWRAHGDSWRAHGEDVMNA